MSTKKSKSKGEKKPRIKRISGETEGGEKRPRRAVAAAKASAEEQAKGVPENGFVVLFRVFTMAEHEELVKLKAAIGEKTGEKTWPAVVKYAMRNAA